MRTSESRCVWLISRSSLLIAFSWCQTRTPTRPPLAPNLMRASTSTSLLNSPGHHSSPSLALSLAIRLAYCNLVRTTIPMINHRHRTAIIALPCQLFPHHSSHHTILPFRENQVIHSSDICHTPRHVCNTATHDSSVNLIACKSSSSAPSTSLHS